ncbi:MAG: hypothetical protein QXR57_00705 [Metallosphaera sp.]
MKSRVVIAGAITVDEILNKNQLIERPGGSPIYSGLGVATAGGLAGAYITIGEDFRFELPSYLTYVEKVSFSKTMRFTLIIEDHRRKLILRFKNGPLIVEEEKFNKWDGVILNPVCNEIPMSTKFYKMPVAVDIQGFIRNCEEGREISYSKKFELEMNSDISIFHANKEELVQSDISVQRLMDKGFKEILISDDFNGFTLYVKDGQSLKLRPSVKGNNEVGNGDFLLASYFTLRLNGEDPISASKMALKLSDEFSILGLNVLPRLS